MKYLLLLAVCLAALPDGSFVPATQAERDAIDRDCYRRQTELNEELAREGIPAATTYPNGHPELAVPYRLAAKQPRPATSEIESLRAQVAKLLKRIEELERTGIAGSP